MYSLSCAAMGDATCNFVAKAETQDEVMNLMMEHIKAHHADKMTDMTPEKMEEMKKMAMSKMTQE